MKDYNWWEVPENKTLVELPISVIQDGNFWCVCANEETEKLLGKDLSSVYVGGGNTKQEAIDSFFSLLRASYSHEKACRMKYQRWVPFRKGNWKHVGGTWFVIFGIHVYLRRGKGMKGGWYVPFTNLNISVYSEWKSSTREN